MRYLLPATLVIAGIIHLLPIVGLFGAPHLHALYGVQIDDPNLIILMRHRAVLFALLGALLVYAAFKPALRVLVIVAGLISATAFAWLALTTPDYNSSLSRVLYADIVAIVCLLVAAILVWRSH